MAKKTNKKSGKDSGGGTESPEIFKIEKPGEKTEIKKVRPKDKDSDEKPDKKQIEKENKQLKAIFAVAGILVLAFLAVMFINYQSTQFTVDGVKYQRIQEGNLIFYDTFLKLYNNAGQPVDYHFYMRNDPRKLTRDVPYTGGELMLTKNMVIDQRDEFRCDGDGVIAVANLVNLYSNIGVKVIKDENASCELTGQYTHVRIESGNETSVYKYGPSCYQIKINDCEILEGTERLMIETLARINEAVKGK